MKKIAPLVFLLSILLPTLASASFDTSLKYGASGNAVTALQNFLQTQGMYAGTIDGVFGSGTLKAVEAFQSANSLQPDGDFGAKSRAKANDILSAASQPSTAAKQAQVVLDSRGCSATSLYSATTGLSCTASPATSTPVFNSAYPPGCYSALGYSRTTALPCSGSQSSLPANPTTTPETTPASGSVSIPDLSTGCSGTTTPSADCVSSILQNLLPLLPIR